MKLRFFPGLALPLLICAMAAMAAASDAPAPKELLEAAQQATELSHLYPYQMSGRVVINRGTANEKSGSVTIYRENTDYRYELRIEGYSEVMMRKGGKLYTLYSAFPAPGLGVIRGIDKWPRQLTLKAITGHTFKKKIGDTERLCVHFQASISQNRACFDAQKSLLIELQEELQTKSFSDYQQAGEVWFPQKVRIARPDMSQNIEVTDIHLERLQPGAVNLEAPKGAHEFDVCDDEQPPTRLGNMFPGAPGFSIRASGLPVYFYGIVDQKGVLHDVAVYAPRGHVDEQGWKEVVQRWRFTPATCGGKPVATEWQSFVTAGLH